MAPSFKDQPWSDRVAAGGLGDMAEEKFEQYMRRKKQNFVRAGLNRPPLQVHKLAMRERYRPDFLTSTGYVEVQGFGRGQTMALKVAKYNCLQFWNNVMPVRIFVYDSLHDRSQEFPLRQVDKWIDSGSVSLKHFPEGHAYFQIPAALIFGDVD